MKKPQLSEMTLKEKIGQMLMLNQFERYEIDGTAVRWSEVCEECDTFWYAFKHGAEKSVGFSSGLPYLANGIMSGADVFVNLYGRAPALMDAFVAALFGEIPFAGKTPVNMKPPKIIFED